MTARRPTGAPVEGIARPPCLLEVIVAERVCNLTCAYCEIGRRRKGGPFAGGEPTSAALPAVEAQLARLAVRHRIPVLKIIGGEIFLLPGIGDFLRRAAPRHEAVVVTTNGTLLHPALLGELAEIRNLALQISLDGHRPEMNRHRFPDPRVHDRVLAAVRECCRRGIPVEINCALSPANLELLPEFAEYLLRLDGRISLQPFPVRWQRDEQFRLPRAAGALDVLQSRHHLYDPVLPPRAYLASLAEFLATGRRAEPCLLPSFYRALAEGGWIRACGCVPARSVNLQALEDGELDDVWRRSRDDRVGPAERISGLCRTCVDQFDILTLAVEGRFPVSELRRIPSWSGPEFLAGIERARADRAASRRPPEES